MIYNCFILVISKKQLIYKQGYCFHIIDKHFASLTAINYHLQNILHFNIFLSKDVFYKHLAPTIKSDIFYIINNAF